MTDSLWTCPVCRSSLNLTGNIWRCQNQHTYDMAKAGYVNLLLANQKGSAEPGDSKQMMQARRRFLNEGHYAPLVSALLDQMRSLPGDSLCIHDAGCGEGYYLGQLVAGLREAGRTLRASGNDISKVAIEMAAKQYKDLHFAVASSYNIPLASHSQTVVLQIFAPATTAEIHRILQPEGVCVQVTPGPGHLHQLRAAVYQSPQPHVAQASLATELEVVHETRLQFEFSLPDKQSRLHLLMMTPYFWQIKEGALDSVLDGMGELAADFSIRLSRACKS